MDENIKLIETITSLRKTVRDYNQQFINMGGKKLIEAKQHELIRKMNEKKSPTEGSDEDAQYLENQENLDPIDGFDN